MRIRPAGRTVPHPNLLPPCPGRSTAAAEVLRRLWRRVMREYEKGERTSGPFPLRQLQLPPVLVGVLLGCLLRVSREVGVDGGLARLRAQQARDHCDDDGEHDDGE